MQMAMEMDSTDYGTALKGLECSVKQHEFHFKKQTSHRLIAVYYNNIIQAKRIVVGMLMHVAHAH